MKTSIAMAIATVFAFITQAFAQDSVEIGTLSCAIGAGAGFIVGSSKPLTCTFKSNSKRFAVETYFGTVNKFGLDVGATGHSLMKWLVMAPATGDYDPGDLSGNYVSANAEATMVVGASTNVLVGGTNRAFALHPVNPQEEIGINLALGVSDFVLRGEAAR